MTLLELKNFTTAKLGITDAATKAQAGEFLKMRWVMIWNAQPWRQARWQETVSVAAGTQDVALSAAVEFVIACRWKDQNELMPMSVEAAFSMNPSGYDQQGTPAAFAQIAKTAGGLAQIRLFQIPNETQNLLVIAKRKCVALVTDTDSPLIPGVDECLQAFAMGDLFQWIRQFGKAQACFEEANALLAKMVEIETAQTTEVRRIIPSVEPDDATSGGYAGPNYFF